MIYVVHGNQKPLLDKKVDELVKKHLNDINEFTLIKYDLEEIPLSLVVNDALTYPFGFEHKVIILNNPYFLLKDRKVTLDFNQTFEEFIEYFNNQSPFTTIIFIALTTKIEKKDDFAKKLMDIAKVSTIKEMCKNDWADYALARVKENDATIKKDALDELVSRVGDDLVKLEQEVDKLCICSKVITLKEVNALVSSKLEDNIFSLLESMIDNDVAKTMKTYNSLRLQNIEPVQLLAIFASQIRFLYHVAVNYEKRMSIDAIADELNANPYRVRLAYNRINKKISSNYLLNILNQLSNLDVDIKTGQTDRFQALEIFILKFTYSLA